MGGVMDPAAAEAASPYAQYTPPGHMEGASPSDWEIQNQRVSPASANDATSAAIREGAYARTQAQQAQYQFVKQQEAQRAAEQQAQQRRALEATQINQYGGFGNQEYSPTRADILTDPFKRSDIFEVTDARQKALMDTGLTQYQAAEQLRFEAQQKGDYAGARKYETLRMQAWTTATGKSGAYHFAAKESGLPQAINPYENYADLVTYAEKGYPQSAKERFSPVDYTKLGLPEGKGGQAYIWGDKPYDLRGAADVAAYALRTGDMGPYANVGKSYSSKYGELSLADQQTIGKYVNENPAHQAKGFVTKDTMGWFTDTVRNEGQGTFVPTLGNYPSPESKKPFVSSFVSEQTTLRPADATISAMSMWGGENSNPIARGLVKLYDFALPGTLKTEKTTKSGDITSVITTTTPSPSGFERGQGVLSDKAYDWLGSKFGISGEQARKSVAMSAYMQKEITNANPSLQNLATNMGVATIKETFDKPAESGIWFGVGLALGGTSRGVEAVYGVGRASIAEKVISQGGKWRTFVQGTDFVVRNTPKALAAIYAVDVSGRSTDWGTNFKAGDVSAKGSVILVHEAIPMAGGTVVGYHAPELASFAYRSAVRTPEKVSDAIWAARQRAAGIQRVEPGTLGYDFTVTGKPVYEVPKTGFRTTSPAFDNSAGVYSWGGVKTKAGSSVPTYDVTPTIDLRPTVDLQTGKVSYRRPENVANLAEQAMIVRQYRLTPGEISLAKRHGLSLNDILSLRKEPEPIQKNWIKYEIANKVDTITIGEQQQKQKSLDFFGSRELVGNNLIRQLYGTTENYAISVAGQEQTQVARPLFGNKELVGNNLIRQLYPPRQKQGIRTIDLNKESFKLANVGGTLTLTTGDQRTRSLVTPSGLTRSLTTPKSDTRLTERTDQRTDLVNISWMGRRSGSMSDLYNWQWTTGSFRGKGGGGIGIPLIPGFGGSGGSGWGGKAGRGRKLTQVFTVNFGNVTMPLFSSGISMGMKTRQAKKKRRK